MMELSKQFVSLQAEKRTCEKHGEYTSSLFTIPTSGEKAWSTCPSCMQEKIKQEDAENVRSLVEERNRIREEAKREAMERVLGRAAIPPRFADRTLESFTTELEGQQRVLRSAMRYVNNWQANKKNGTSMIFCGRPGTGKTHLAVGIIKKVLEMGDTAMFTHVLEYTRAIKQSWADRNEPEVIQQFVSPDLLVIDEVGHQYGSDAERLMLFDLINARYMAAKPMILITNLELNGLREYLDERAQDRLREGGGTALVFDWISQRK